MAPEMSSIDLRNVGLLGQPGVPYTFDLELAKPHQENIVATDYYEILRVGPQADQDTIERVYRTLADRFHPDNTGTGNPQTFLRLGEAYETLSNLATRNRYNVSRQYDKARCDFGCEGVIFSMVSEAVKIAGLLSCVCFIARGSATMNRRV